ncbi:MAG: tetratricopeptide repeat protein [Cytophagaceae bacterium]|nr:MAG: tetratricopeptide repeat protein [Cytophagaceae bacterium]
MNQPRGLGITLMNLAIVMTNREDLDSAEPLLSEALRLRTEQGDSYGIATVLVNRGALELRRGANRQAEATYQEALDRFLKIGDRRGETVALEGLVEALLNQDRPSEALRFFQEAIWLRQEYKLPETALQTLLPARIRQALGEDVYDNIFAATYLARSE